MKKFVLTKSRVSQLTRALEIVALKGDVDIIRYMVDLALVRRKIRIEESYLRLVNSMDSQDSCFVSEIKFVTYAKYLPFSSYFFPKGKNLLFLTK